MQQTTNRTSATPSVISLFTGAGGLDLGFEAAGFETRVAVEFDGDAVKTLRENRDWPVIHADIHDQNKASSAELLRVAGAKEGNVDVLIGGPPCQPFSKSGYWASGDSRRLADPRATTLGAYLRVLEDLKPRAFLLENVPGLAFSKKDEGLVFLRRSIEAINKRTRLGYSFSAEILNAAEYGIPQERQRVFLVGSRDGTQFKFPRPRYSNRLSEPSLAFEEGKQPYHTAWDAIGGIEEDPADPELRLTGKWADLLPSIPEGQNYLYHTDRGDGLSLFGWRTRYWSFLLKLAKRLPSWTIAAQPGPAIGPFHWQNRRLSRTELARLQTFPANFTVPGTLRTAQKQLGNAVPSALAELLALSIRTQLFGDNTLDPSRSVLLPERSSDIPASERVHPVPRKFRDLVGEYVDHPGTGKGPGALARLGADG